MNNIAFNIKIRIKPITNYSDAIRIVSEDNLFFLDASCFWQIVENEKIILTSNDFFSCNNDQPIFINIFNDFNEKISQLSIERIEINNINMKLFFENNIKIYLYTSSTKYESWNLHIKNKQYICMGNGEIAIFSNSYKP